MAKRAKPNVRSSSSRQPSSRPPGNILQSRRIRHIIFGGLVVYLFLSVNNLVYHPGHLIKLVIQSSHFFRNDMQIHILPARVGTYHRQSICPPPTDKRPPRIAQLHLPWLAKQPNLMETTSVLNSTYEIVNPKPMYNICDQIEVFIQARDWRNQRKLYGGDYFRAKIYRTDRLASAPSDGDVIDNGDGTYSAFFTLRWSGEAKVGVNLIHPSEGVVVLHQLREEVPARFAYTGRFISKDGNVTENVDCHVSMENHKGPLCDFSNAETGASWFCARPKNPYLNCSDWIWHESNITKANELAKQLVTAQEAMLFYIQKAPIKRLWHHAVNVSWPTEHERRAAASRNLSVCRPGLPMTSGVASGYFFQDVWFSNQCTIRRFSCADALECLQHKTLHFLGDSTVRQFLQFFLLRLGRTLKRIPLEPHVNWKVGPFGAHDESHNITMLYRHHGFPIRNSWTVAWHVDYMVNVLNSIQGGSDTVVILTAWAHFTATNVTYYATRMHSVLEAIKRLHQRSPKTLVVIRSANTREHDGPTGAMYTSDWFAYDLDNVMRSIFSQYPKLAFINVWDMSSSHYSKDQVHPPEVIVANVVNQLLTYICPSDR